MYDLILFKVWKNRTATSLFDCKQYAHDLEDLFHKMWNRFSNKKRVDHINNGEVNGVSSTSSLHSD